MGSGVDVGLGATVGIKVGVEVAVEVGVDVAVGTADGVGAGAGTWAQAERKKTSKSADIVLRKGVLTSAKKAGWKAPSPP